MANAFNVAHLLAPLFDYTPPPPPVALNGAAPPPPIINPYAAIPMEMAAPSASVQHAPPAAQPFAQSLPPQSAQDVLMQARQQGLIPEASPVDSPVASSSSQHVLKRTHESFEHDDVKRFRSEYTNGFQGPSPPFREDPSQPSLPSAPTTNFRTTLRKSNRNPVALTSFDPATLESNRTLLKSVFSLENEASDAAQPPPVPDLSQHLPPDLPADLPIDENYHTALHWAAALGRLSVVQAFFNYGADLHLGNNVGETPLIRAILVTNNSDQDTFGRLLEFLSPSLRTVDNSGRSVLHHCALVAGVKGRAASARYYLETILVYIAKNEKGRFEDLINAQDSHGDTALNIAARIGNRALVRMLLDAGADKLTANKLGLRPTDFGVEEPVSKSSSIQDSYQFRHLTQTYPSRRISSRRQPKRLSTTSRPSRKCHRKRRLRSFARSTRWSLPCPRRSMPNWRRKLKF